MADPTLKIAVLPGDGIGPEVTAPALAVLGQVQDLVGGFQLEFTEWAAGAGCYGDTGIALPAKTLDACRQADAILLAAMGLPSVRTPEGTEITPQIDLRIHLGLYAGVRPVRSLPGLPPILANPNAAKLDFVLIRESTEGLFASKDRGVVLNDAVATETLVLTRATTERLFDFGLRLARKRKAQGHPGLCTCVDKANVFSAFAFMRRIFDERAEAFPDVQRGYSYVDAAALDMVRKPWTFDVMVTENMFGDILSDLGAGLMGGMGMAPSADIGDMHGLFQPCHGTAPDIAGQGKANPTAMILSAAMMLDWLGDTRNLPACHRAAALIVDAVDAAYAGGELLPFELGGSADTSAITHVVQSKIAMAAAA